MVSRLSPIAAVVALVLAFAAVGDTEAPAASSSLMASVTRVLITNDTTFDAQWEVRCVGRDCAAAMLVLYPDGIGPGSYFERTFRDDVVAAKTPVSGELVLNQQQANQSFVLRTRHVSDLSDVPEPTEVLLGFIASGDSDFRIEILNGTVLGRASSTKSEWLSGYELGAAGAQISILGASAAGWHRWHAERGVFGFMATELAASTYAEVTGPEGTQRCIKECEMVLVGGPGDYSAFIAAHVGPEFVFPGVVLAYSDIAVP